MTTDRRATQQLLIGSYTDDAGHDGVVQLADAARPDTIGHRLDLRNASWLEWWDDTHVLACSELPESELVLLACDEDRLSVLDRQATGGADACHLAISPDRRWVAVANYTSGQLTVFPAPDDDRLPPAVAVLDFAGHGPVPDRQESAHAHQCHWLDAEHLLVNDLGSDQLHVVQLQSGGSGTVTLRVVGGVELPPGTGPRHAVLRRGEGHLDVAVCGELSGEVVCFRHPDSEAWQDGWRQLARISGTRQPGGSQPSGLRAWGERLVLGNRRCNTVSLLDWDRDGQLTLRQEGSCGGANPRDVVVHDDRVWVANQDDGAVAVLEPGEEGYTLVDTFHRDKPARLLFG